MACETFKKVGDKWVKISDNELKQMLLDDDAMYEMVFSKAPIELKGKAKIARGLDTLATILDARKNLISEEKKPELIQALKDIADGLIEEGLATADNVVQKVKEYVKGKVSDEDFEAVKQEIMTSEKAESGQEKSLLNRAFKGQTDADVKQAIAKHGLTYQVESHIEAERIADEIIADIGVYNALEAVRRYEINGAPAAFIMGKAVDAINNDIAAETDAARLNELLTLQSKILSEFDERGRETGRFASALQAVYESSDFQYSFERQVAKYKENNGGVIPADVEAKMKELSKQLDETKKKLAEAEKKKEEAEQQRAVDNIKEDIDRKKTIKPDAIKKAANELASKIRKGKLARPDVFSAASPASIVWDTALEIVAKTIESGGSVAQAVSNGLDHIKNSDWYKSLNKTKAKEAEDAYREYMDSVSTEVEDGLKVKRSKIRELVASGIDNINDLVSALKKEYPTATEREIRDAITGYGRVVNPNKDEVDAQIRKIKRIGRVISALEDVQAKKRPLRSGLQRDKLDAEERALNKQLREAMKELPIDEATQERQLKTALDAAKQRLKNQIEDLQREIDNNERVPKSARTTRADAELESLKEQRDALKKQADNLFKDDDFVNQKRLEIAKRNAEKKIAEYERRIKEKDFAKRTRKELDADKELLDLRVKQQEIKDEFDKLQYENELNNRNTVQKLRDTMIDVWNLPRLLRATGEASFIMIQGGLLSTAHPVLAARAFTTALKSFTSKSAHERWQRELQLQPYYKQLKDVKLSITQPDGKLSVKEEQFLGNATKTFWDAMGVPFRLVGEKAYEGWKNANPLEAFERASVGYMNTLRVERYLDGTEMLEMQGKNYKDNPQDYKNVADAINTFTGRASLGAAERIAKPLANVFFSPRNWASILKQTVLLPRQIYKWRDSTKPFKPSVAQKMVMADYMKYVGVTGSIVMLAAAALNNDDDEETGVEFDPRSSDFLKIKYGNTRVDPWGGRIQQIVLMARLITDSIKKGETVTKLGSKFGVGTKYDLLLDQAYNKLAPSAAILKKLLDTKERVVDGKVVRVDKYGNEISAYEQIPENLYPIFYETIYETYKDQPATVASFLTFLAFIGEGVNTYEEKSKKKAKEAQSTTQRTPATRPITEKPVATRPPATRP